MGNFWIFKKHQRWIWLSVGGHLAFALFVYAAEVSQIPPATANEPKCASMQYRENCMDQMCRMMAPYSKPTCDSCKGAVTSAVNEANGALTSAKGRDAAINASNAAANAGDAAATGSLQHDPQFRTGSVNQTAMNSLTEQQGLASDVSRAMKACSTKIKDKCSGGLAEEDKQAANQSAQSCDQSAAAADQVATDKAAKAAEMAKNGQQANQNGQGMQPPQMPQGGAGSPGLGADPYDSKVSSSIDKAKTAKLDSGFSVAKPEIPLGQGQAVDSGLSSGRNFTPTANGTSAGEESKTASFTGGNESGSSASRGISSSGGAGSLGSSAGGAESKDGEKSFVPVEAKTVEDALAGGGSSSFKPTLGLKSSGEELTDLLNQQNGANGSIIGGNFEAAGQQMAASNGSASESGDTVSLFLRIKTKITSVSRARNMQ